jgi:hypothetical protein
MNLEVKTLLRSHTLTLRKCEKVPCYCAACWCKAVTVASVSLSEPRFIKNVETYLSAPRAPEAVHVEPEEYVMLAASCATPRNKVDWV